MTNETSADISKKLNVLIALALRQLHGDKDFSKGRRKQGAGDLTRYLADMGMESKDIADVLGSPLTSVRTLLTPARRR
jgi:hypothetical protein